MEKKKASKQGINRWMAEEWVSVDNWLKGQKVPCGSDKAPRIHSCRPLKRITAGTPITIPEIIKQSGRSFLEKKVKEKKAQPEKLIFWDEKMARTKAKNHK
jgi:hypothetical protein